jgi:hypothetical protein
MSCTSGYNQTNQTCSQTADQGYSQCTQTQDQGYSQCTQTQDQGYSQCTQTQDQGYSQCTQQADQGYNACSSWGWFSFVCNWVSNIVCVASTWISNIVCVTSTWISNIVCVASTWISNIVCVASTWISNVVCVAWNVVTTFICVAWDVVTSIINVIVETLGSIVSVILNAIAFVVLAFFEIPYVGRFLSWVWNGILSIANFFAGLGDTILGWVGIRPEKRLYLLVINQQDERGNPVATEGDLIAGIATAIQVFRDQANVRVLPVKLFNYKTAASGNEQASDDYISNATSPSTADTLDVNCGSSDLADDIGVAGADFQNMLLTMGFWTGWRRLTGYGAPLCAFSVRSFSGTSDGCSLGPLTDYVMVNFANASVPDTGGVFGKDSILPHELGHACNLFHVGAPNLMASSDPRAINLDAWQIALLRASRHVAYF